MPQASGNVFDVGQLVLCNVDICPHYITSLIDNKNKELNEL